MDLGYAVVGCISINRFGHMFQKSVFSAVYSATDITEFEIYNHVQTKSGTQQFIVCWLSQALVLIEHEAINYLLVLALC
jgi:hypothetical protein